MLPIVCLALALVPGFSAAQDPQAAEASDSATAEPAADPQDTGDDVGDGVGGVPDLDPTSWFPSVRIVGSYTDNYFNQPDGGQRDDVAGVVITPVVSYLDSTSRFDVQASAVGEYGTFDIPGETDDYIDGSFSANTLFKATRWQRLGLAGSYEHGHDQFGVDRTENAGAPAFFSTSRELDEWDLYAGRVRYEYGAHNARVNSEVGGGVRRKEYTTNRAATEFLNSQSVTFDYALFYNYSPKTSAVIDFKRTDVDFEAANDVAGETREGRLHRMRGGLRWLATAKTSGDVRVGYRLRTYNRSTRRVNGLDWQASIDWSPMETTLLQLRSGFAEVDSYKADQTRSINTEFIALDGSQTWTSRFKTIIGVEWVNLEFVDGDRSDSTFRPRLGFDYRLLRNLALTGNARYTLRDSTEPGLDFDRFNATLGLRFGRY